MSLLFLPTDQVMKSTKSYLFSLPIEHSYVRALFLLCARGRDNSSENNRLMIPGSVLTHKCSNPAPEAVDIVLTGELHVVCKPGLDSAP